MMIEPKILKPKTYIWNDFSFLSYIHELQDKWSEKNI